MSITRNYLLSQVLNKLGNCFLGRARTPSGVFETGDFVVAQSVGVLQTFRRCGHLSNNANLPACRKGAIETGVISSADTTRLPTIQ